MKSGADKTILKKLYIKTVAAAATLIMVITMTVSVTYAWLILSTSPTASGAQVSLQGGKTILLAQDITEDVGGVTVHYPGKFSDKLSISYDYLSNLAGLSPVSTADGLHWMLKTSGGYTADTTLTNANLTNADSSGHYVYLDFWVVSPGPEYTVRVSSGTGTGGRGGNGTKDGSSLIEFPVATADAGNISGFALSDPAGNSAASLRIGFLVSSEVPADANMRAYMNSASYDGAYKKLVGVYQAKNEDLPTDLTKFSFTVYEPNGTLHSGTDNGKYLITKPIDKDGNETDIKNILTVQTENVWKMDDEGGNFTGLKNRFQNTDLSDLTGTVNKENVVGRFFGEKLGWANVRPYITPGSFFTKTADLYGADDDGNGVVDNVSAIQQSGATDDVSIVRLDRCVPQRIRMFIWLEGQDADCRNITPGTTDFIISLELAGADK